MRPVMIQKRIYWMVMERLVKRRLVRRKRVKV